MLPQSDPQSTNDPIISIIKVIDQEFDDPLVLVCIKLKLNCWDIEHLAALTRRPQEEISQIIQTCGQQLRDRLGLPLDALQGIFTQRRLGLL